MLADIENELIALADAGGTQELLAPFEDRLWELQHDRQQSMEVGLEPAARNDDYSAFGVLEEEEEEEEEDEDEDEDDDDDDDDAEEDDDDEEEAEAWSPGDRIGVRAISRSSPSPPPTHMATAPEDRPMLESHENEEQCAAHIRGWLMGLSDIEATFDRLDVNRDGFLSRGELEALVESGGESISAAAACSPSGIARYCQRSSFRLTSPRRSSPQN